MIRHKNTDRFATKTPISFGDPGKETYLEHNLTEKQVPIREPDQLIVLTGGTMAYTRQDGVKIIPLGCLKW